MSDALSAAVEHKNMLPHVFRQIKMGRIFMARDFLQWSALFILQQLDIRDMVNAIMTQLLIIKSAGTEVVQAVHADHFKGMQNIFQLFLTTLALKV